MSGSDNAPPPSRHARDHCQFAHRRRIAQARFGAEHRVHSDRELCGVGRPGRHTGYGPGWIALTVDTSGQPHGPITGYLYHDGVARAVGNDHFGVSSYYTAPAASVNTPFAGGYAYAHCQGCTWSYLDSVGAELAGEGALHTGGCPPPNHTTRIFCYHHAAGVTAAPANLISHVNSGTVYVRYVTKHDDYVLANLAANGSPQLPFGLQWGFYPRSCLTAG